MASNAKTRAVSSQVARDGCELGRKMICTAPAIQTAAPAPRSQADTGRSRLTSRSVRKGWPAMMITSTDTTCQGGSA
nr:hypothetical protein GCM10020092_030980 [Actinoplanes digitatis]